MARGSSERGPYVIVVGDPDQEFVREMVRTAREGGVEPLLCEDVYGAVAAAAGAGGRRTLVLGRMQELSRENGSFFPLAAANAVRCGCLLEPGRAARQSAVAAALQAGTCLAGATGEVRAFLRDWLAAGQRPRGRQNRQTLPEGDWRATEAELKALFGQQANA